MLTHSLTGKRPSSHPPSSATPCSWTVGVAATDPPGARARVKDGRVATAQLASPTVGNRWCSSGVVTTTEAALLAARHSTRLLSTVARRVGRIRGSGTTPSWSHKCDEGRLPSPSASGRAGLLCATTTGTTIGGALAGGPPSGRSGAPAGVGCGRQVGEAVGARAMGRYGMRSTLGFFVTAASSGWGGT